MLNECEVKPRSGEVYTCNSHTCPVHGERNIALDGYKHTTLTEAATFLRETWMRLAKEQNDNFGRNISDWSAIAKEVEKLRQEIERFRVLHQRGENATVT